MMNQNNSDQKRALSDDIICCSDTQSDDYKLTDSGNLSDFPEIRSNRRGLVHSVSIIVEPAISIDQCSFDEDIHLTPPVPTERRRTIAGPIVVMEDLYYDQQKKSKEYDDIVQSLFASARLRKEEFARLLEEHAQIVKEINKAETNLL